jgi:hypothetical protein
MASHKPLGWPGFHPLYCTVFIVNSGDPKMDIEHVIK